MDETEFHSRIDQIYVQLEDMLDESGLDLDIESSGGVMILTIESNGSRIILSRQPAVAELWVAARSGGFHFRRNASQWRCATGETLSELLSRVLTEQSDESVVIRFTEQELQ